MFTLQASTELMKSHKAAQVIADQSAFCALQTSDGLSLFFGIGDDNILYLTAEQMTATGWTPVDLTTELAANFPEKTIACKHFAAGQDRVTGTITLAQIVRVDEDDSDHLFVLTGLSDQSNSALMQSPASRSWLPRPYDSTSSGALTYVAIPVTSAPYILAGVTNPSTGFIQNYTVNLTASTGVWTPFPTAENFDTLNGIASGQPGGAMVPGIYLLTQLSGGPSLTFNPWRGVFGPPDVTKFTVPSGATAIATAPGNGGTDLYVAGDGAVYLFPAQGQANLAHGIQIFSDPWIANVDGLNAHVSEKQITVWGRTNAGIVFYSRCTAGSQSDSTAWSAPIPLLTGIDRVASMLDLDTGSSVLFAHTSGQRIVQLNQDPVTTEWHSRSILLPSPSIHDVVEFYTHTTRIEVLDDNHLPLPGQTFDITATSPCSVYVEDVYVRLSPSVALQVTADGQGSVTIVQETEQLAAVCYNLGQGDGSVLNVNPMSGCLKKMSGIQNGADLSNVQVTNESGQTSPLVAPTVPASNTNAVAQGLARFVKTSQTLPQNGSVQRASVAPLAVFNSTAGDVWGMTFGDGITYFEGPAQLATVGVAGSMSLEGGDWLEAWAGDVWKWIEHALDEVKKFFVQVVDGVTHFFIEIGEKLYHFVVQCIADVAHGIEFILNAIKVGFEKLVQWVGFIFSWEDIKRTHSVLKNMILCHVRYAIAQLPTAKSAIQNLCQNLENFTDKWAELPTTGSAGDLAKSHAKPQGSDSPASHYGIYHAKNNANNSTTSYSPTVPGGSELERILAELSSMVSDEAEDLMNAIDEFKTQVVDNFGKLPAYELGQKLLSIVFKLIVESAENVMDHTIDIISILAQGALDALDRTIEIPVLSWLYTKLTGDPLSFLDLVCLVAAIPVTIVVKLVSGEAPFPAGDFSNQLVGAQSFEDIQALYRRRQVLVARESVGNAPAADAGMSASAVAKLNLAGGVVGFVGSAMIILFGALKAQRPSSAGLAVCYASSFLLYTGPDWTGQIVEANDPPWYVDANTVIAAVATVKTFGDISLCKFNIGTPQDSALARWKMASPVVECIVNLLWEVPVTATYLANRGPDSSKVGLAGNTAFNFGGVISPGMSSKNKEVALGFLIACSVCSGIYGALMVAQGALLYKGK